MAKILNYGSLNIDRVYAMDHIVTPGETTASLDYNTFPGGKGLNQSIALARAGAKVLHAGCIGADGEWLRKLLDESGVDTGLLRTVDTPTGHAVIQVERSGQNCILLYGGANQRIPDDLAREAVGRCERGDILVLQNEVNGNAEIMALARGAGMRIALNPSPIDNAVRALPLGDVEWLLLNEVEGHALTGERDAAKICAVLLERYPRLRVVLTLGGSGVLYRDSEVELRHGIYDVPVVDTTAAGDTFTGYFLGSIARGDDAARALEMASVASSISVSRRGAAPSIPTLDEVLGADLKQLMR